MRCYYTLALLENGHFARGVPRFSPFLMQKWSFRSERPSILGSSSAKLAISLEAPLDFGLFFCRSVPRFWALFLPKWPFRSGRPSILAFFSPEMAISLDFGLFSAKIAISLRTSLDFGFFFCQSGHFARGVPRFCFFLLKW